MQLQQQSSTPWPIDKADGDSANLGIHEGDTERSGLLLTLISESAMASSAGPHPPRVTRLAVWLAPLSAADEARCSFHVPWIY